jgi:hypothetical protein
MPPPQNQGHRINEQIRISPVRLIDAEGQPLGVVPTLQAMEKAREAGGGSAGLNETRSLLFSALLLADRLHDMASGTPVVADSAPAVDKSSQVAEALEGLASRLENLALRLEN